MNNIMKIGVKTFKNEEFLNYFKNKADFFEIQAIQTNNYEFLKKFSKPMVIHAEHLGSGINPCDKMMLEKNLKSLNFARKLADNTNAKKIIFHPGYLLNETSKIKNSAFLVNSLNDKRIIIENLSSHNKGICTTPDEMKKFLEKTKLNFCLDISHAVIVAKILKIDYIKFLKDFIKLKPTHYHISGKDMNSEKDNHYSFSDKDSNIPIKEILELFPEDAEITLETNPDIKKTQEDLRIIRKIISEIT